MKKSRILRGCNILLIWMVIPVSFLHAQSPEELVAVQQQKLAQVYAREHGNMGQLIYGKVHEDYYSSAKGSPFWLSAEWTVGSLQTTQLYYPELLLRYDAHLDALVFAADMINQTFIWVNEDEVESFWIQGKQFDYLGRGEEQTFLEAAGLTTGYAELMYKGESKLYARREKRFQKYRDDYEYSGEFDEKSVYVLQKNQSFRIIKGRKDLIEFAGDHETEMEQYMEERGIQFRSMTDDQLVQLIAYYDSL